MPLISSSADLALRLASSPRLSRHAVLPQAPDVPLPPPLLHGSAASLNSSSPLYCVACGPDLSLACCV